MIAQSFYLATQKFVPFSELFTADGILLAFSLITAYFIIITSWIGYYNSIKKSGYTETKLGATRFGIDFIILFLYYYLITLLTTKIEQPDPLLAAWMKPNYFDVFVWFLPILFAIYLAWDIVKFYEYQCESKKKQQDRRNRMTITVIFFLAFIGQSLAYSMLTPRMELVLNGYVIWDFIFMISSTLLVLAYRKRKVLSKSRKVKDESSKGKKQKEATVNE